VDPVCVGLENGGESGSVDIDSEGKLCLALVMIVEDRRLCILSEGQDKGGERKGENVVQGRVLCLSKTA